MQGFGTESMAADCSLTFLGTGTSVGVPVIGCGCAVCLSDDPRNQRFRSSVVVRAGSTTLLVDSGPDLRCQALREGLDAVDAVLYTHEHLDHVVGFDELRAFCWRRDDPLPLYGTAECLGTLERMFRWAFSSENKFKGYVRPESRVVDGPFVHGDLAVTPLPVEHGSVRTIGFRFESDPSGSLAYISDVKRVPATTLDLIRGVDVLIVDALRPTGHPTHMSTAEALELIELVGPGRAWLTHLGHENDHAALEAELPAHVRVAYDGLRINF